MSESNRDVIPDDIDPVGSAAWYARGGPAGLWDDARQVYPSELADLRSESDNADSDSSQNTTDEETPLLPPADSLESDADCTTNYMESIRRPSPSQGTDSPLVEGGRASDGSKIPNKSSLNKSIRNFIVAYDKLEEHKARLRRIAEEATWPISSQSASNTGPRSFFQAAYNDTRDPLRTEICHAPNVDEETFMNIARKQGVEVSEAAMKALKTLYQDESERATRREKLFGRR